MFFFFNDTATTEIYTLSLHDALPICVGERRDFTGGVPTGALVLIGLGVLFLLHNLNIWFLEVDTLWPVLLIGLGLWLFAKRKACNRSEEHTSELQSHLNLVFRLLL